MVMALIMGLNPVWAQEPPAQSSSASDELVMAKQLFETGRRLYREGAYLGAIEAWAACYDLTGHEELLFNLAQAWEREGDLDRAIAYLDRYRAWVIDPQREHELARKSLALRARRGDLDVTGTVEEVLEATPYALGAPEDGAPSPSSGRSRRRAGVALTAVGATSLGAALGFALAAQNARSDVVAQCVQGTTRFLCPESADETLSAYRRRGNTAWAVLGIGVVAAASGVGLVVMPTPDGSPTVAVRWPLGGSSKGG